MTNSTTQVTKHDLGALLKQELSSRQAKNPQYSLRAFARFLNVDPSYLSKVLHGSRCFSDKTCQEILAKLRASEEVALA